MQVYKNSQDYEKMLDLLNGLLSGFQIYYQNLRGFHWNIKGEKFFELHEKFESWYDDAAEKIDEIAERILALNGVPLHDYGDYLKQSPVSPVKKVSDARTAMETVRSNMETLLQKEREILDLASENGDEGTLALMSEYISEQEKLLWMLNAYLS